MNFWDSGSQSDQSEQSEHTCVLLTVVLGQFHDELFYFENHFLQVFCRLASLLHAGFGDAAALELLHDCYHGMTSPSALSREVSSTS